MDLADVLLNDSLSQFQRFYDYRPFGHADTLCPDGRVWRENEWSRWSNKPWQLEFHNSKAYHRAILGANGVGKSIAPSWETVLHATGLYDDHPWYQGRRFDRPVKIWVGAIDADQQRQGVQTHLLGQNLGEGLGTGFVPKDLIVGKVRTRQAGMTDVADQLQIRHVSGGTSTLMFKTYQQGWRSWQAAAPDIVQLDEEPDETDSKQGGVWSECVTRVVRSGGIIMAGLTPLLGETELTRHFMHGPDKGVFWIGATWDDAPHMSEDAKATAMASYRDTEIEARTKGLPMMGEGRIFAFREDEVRIADFQIPRHYARVAGIDFGIGAGHPTAGAWLAWDRDKDVVYLYDEYRVDRQDAIVHAEAFKRRGDWIPVAWPHDGHKTSDLTRAASDGREVQEIYRNHGLNMLAESARYDDKTGGSQPQWPIIETLQEMAATGRFRVFASCGLFFEECRSFHTKGGKIVNRRDDVIKAVLYALMSLRYAHTEPVTARKRHMPQALRL